MELHHQLKEITSIEDYRQIAIKITKAEGQVGDQIRLRVISNSMAPLLKVGDKVIVAPNSPAELRRGDVIVVWRNDEFITHRLVTMQDGLWYTKGDRSRHLDHPVTTDAVLGKVIAVQRGDILLNYQEPWWIVTNRIDGLLNWWEALFFKIGRTLKRKIFPN